VADIVNQTKSLNFSNQTKNWAKR